MKADDYISDGIFEMARYGKKIMMHNNTTPIQHKQIMKVMSDRYEPIIDEINSKIGQIKTKILLCDPVKLLSFSADMGLMPMMHSTSEFNLSVGDIPVTRATEYIQSIFVSSPKMYIPESEGDPSERFFSIISEIEELHQLMQEFTFCWGARLNELRPDIDDDTKAYLIELQIMYGVRGQRYQVFEVPYFEKLLSVHDEVFLELFGMNSSQIIAGIEKLQYSLTQRKLDVVKKLGNFFDKYGERELNSLDFCPHDLKSVGTDFYNKFFGTKLREVVEITNWTKVFVDELSWEQDATRNFFEQEFSGWPIIDLPIFKRPFIKINDLSYCFDYYCFVDYFYRAIQKTVTRLKPTYQWSDRQQFASERMVEQLFKKILPGSTTYLANYYPLNGSIKKMAENDLIVIYDDILIIVEVKAGSFVYTSPLNDFDSHIKSYKTLIEKADLQCFRTREYLENQKTANLYHEDGTEKVIINLDQISSIYTVSVTIDNINILAAKAEKVKFLELKSHSISIAVDDLMVYAEYFNSPLLFLHFLQQRNLATQEPKLALNDELDHLGMYIAHNCYSMQVDTISKNGIGFFVGYREDLDEYFGKLYHKLLIPKKPLQNIPNLFMEIIDYLESQAIPSRSYIANYFLNFAQDAKIDLCNTIDCVLKRQKQVHMIIPFNASGVGDSLRYTCVVNQEGVSKKSDVWKREYTLANLCWNKENDRHLIDIYFDNQGRFIKVTLKRYVPQDIKKYETEKIHNMGKDLAMKRMENYRHSNNSKIGRNQLCPCGSGKKYKKCCGK